MYFKVVAHSLEVKIHYGSWNTSRNSGDQTRYFWRLPPISGAAISTSWHFWGHFSDEISWKPRNKSLNNVSGLYDSPDALGGKIILTSLLQMIFFQTRFFLKKSSFIQLTWFFFQNKFSRNFENIFSKKKCTKNEPSEICSNMQS